MILDEGDRRLTGRFRFVLRCRRSSGVVLVEAVLGERADGFDLRAAPTRRVRRLLGHSGDDIPQTVDPGLDRWVGGVVEAFTVDDQSPRNSPW